MFRENLRSAPIQKDWSVSRQSVQSYALASDLPQDYDLRQRTGRPMSHMRGESRRSTRVPLKVVISAHGPSEPLTCDGETIVVNRHGARILCTVPLRLGLKIEIHVIITDKSANAEVVYVDPERPFVCGIELHKPENIWGLSLPPDDWYEHSHEAWNLSCMEKAPTLQFGAFVFGGGKVGQNGVSTILDSPSR
jgi:hypothetical protein